jgi:hypothetical protein
MFEGTVPTPLPGTYHVRVVGEGLTLRGARFTREQLLTAVALPGGDRPPAGPVDDGHRICELLECLTKVSAKFLERNSIDPQAVERCLREHCSHDHD